jgi:uncharacterized membrane protein
MPQIPPPEGLHPLVVHFPVAVFFIALAPLAFALVFRKQAATWAWATVLLLAIATAGAFAAVATGESAEDAAGPVSATAAAALHDHEENAELVRMLLPVTLAFGVVLAGLLSMKNRDARLITPAALVLAGSWTFAALRLAETAHQGGVLVHGHGIHAPVAAPPADPGRAPDREEDERNPRHGSAPGASTGSATSGGPTSTSAGPEAYGHPRNHIPSSTSTARTSAATPTATARLRIGFGLASSFRFSIVSLVVGITPVCARHPGSP